jgi:hydrophobic/amphiphilic exporter-1 (mainly G- bacteria), HAE1 family
MAATDRGNTSSYSFFKFVVERPVAVTMLVLAVLVFGMISLGRLPLTLMPDISYPSVTLRTSFDGAAPEEVEQFVSRPIEQVMGVVGNKISIISVSRSNESEVVVEFGWDTDMDVAIQEIREKLEMVRLPDGADRPLILRYDPALDPVIRIGLSRSQKRLGKNKKSQNANTFNSEMRALRFVAEDLVKRELEKMPGVAAVKVRGGLEEEIRVELDERELSPRSLSIQNITSQLARENVNLAGGNLKEGKSEYAVRVLSEFASIEDIAAMRIKTQDGAWIKLADIANVSRGNKEAKEITRVNGVPSVEIEIHKEADANIVKVASAMRWRLFGPSGITKEKLPATPADSTSSLSEKSATDKPDKKKRGRGGRGPGKPWWLSGVLAQNGLQLNLLSDQSTFIQASLDELRNTALLGGLFAIMVLFIFLRSVPATVIVALAIPLSVIAAFGPMKMAGLSLNIMSLGGLALGIGMLVDNSIVVLESIFRCRQEGDSRHKAAIRGTGEVGQAVFASTLTTVAVFFPMVFVEGVAGQVFGDMAKVVVYSLSASLVLALSFIPMLSALGSNSSSNTDAAPTRERLLKLFIFSRLNCLDHIVRDWKFLKEWRQGIFKSIIWIFSPLYLGVRFILHLLSDLILRIIAFTFWLLFQIVLHTGGALGWLLGMLSTVIGKLAVPFETAGRFYPGLLSSVLRHPFRVILPAIILVALVGFKMVPNLGSELMPEVHQGEFHIELRLPLGTPLERTAARAEIVEEYLRNRAEIASVALMAGQESSGGLGQDQGEHLARLTVRLIKSSNPLLLEQQLLTDLRPFLEQLPEVNSRVSYPVLFSFKTPIEILINGHELSTLRQTTGEILNLLEDVAGLTDVNSGAQDGNPEVRIRYDRNALGRLGLNLQNVARLVRNKVLGQIGTEFRDGDRQLDIRVKLNDLNLKGMSAIRDLVINPGQSIAIPLSAVAEVSLDEGPAEIRRVDQERCAVIQANISGRDLGNVLQDIENSLNDYRFPEGTDWVIKGQSREMQKSLGSLKMALLLAIFLVYVVMASQFESLFHPLVILFSIPLAFVGVIPVLYLSNTPVSVLVFLGGIMLVGIVVNNAIILVDTINLQRRKGLERYDAVIKAAHLRLRPILMTTATTVLGLLPMAIGFGEGAEMRRPMAITVIAGLLSSTFLTLLLVPVLYDRFEALLEFLRPGRKADQ